ncbi:MAG: replicative DNA helicase [Erysipelotrichia bacterium]|nr:replicative DNA helicase [Candidatus Riflebacteria bacterium]NCB39536.1 replicative DNA helicase [Erysipelotrichia bacterium]
MSDVFYKVPPHSLEAEQSVLGSMMLSEDAVIVAMEIVEAVDFYQSSHRHIFQALVDLYNAQRPCDLITLQEELRSKDRIAEIGGVSYLSQLLNVVPTSRNAEHYARIVKEKSMLRRLILLSGEISTNAYDPQAQAELLIDQAEQKVLQLSQFKVTRPYLRVKDLVKPTFNYLESLYENKQAVTGIPSGFTKLDEYTAGFQKSDLIIIAARPSMGKTAFCLNIAQYAAYNTQQPVMLFSLEMSHTQLVTRLLCSEARIDGQKVRRGYLGDEDWTKLSITAGILADTPILIDDTANASLLEIRSKARRAYAQDKIGMIIIDYLQLISWSGNEKPESRQQEVSAISRSLKGLARELNVPVICLSQLSRAVESRTDKRPILSDLRESGAIEQDADVVMFLYRDFYYNPQKEESKGKGEVIIAKQRNGPVGSLELAFNSNFAKFDNLETIYTEN